MTILTMQRSERVKALIASGVLLGCLALASAAAFTSRGTAEVFIDGSNNTFTLAVAGSTQDSWQPTGAEWADSSTAAPAAAVDTGGEPMVFAVNEPESIRVAVKNQSEALVGTVALAVTATATPEVLDHLYVTIRSQQATLVREMPLSRLRGIPWAADLAPGRHEVLDVTIELRPAPAPLPSENPVTVHFSFTGENR
ncbi:hypothetical protein [Leucobacter luti]|uniref:Ribosomally synthesized peptide with SipW-like signal peptide n=1 Tax=Leucobacter luti TaxID=340320 RepID=A0A4R6RXB1_9MICO|nr:hypothetical protein [Leucobacter luti]QYM75619.1 hypothetical protein K1X41_13515 [Leucobacter luti]TDP91701.1 hypothetical protein EDF62_2320 [Leucobacter luti]